MDLTQRPFERTIGGRDLSHWRTPPGRALARLVLAASRWTTWTWTAIILAAIGSSLAFLGSWAAIEIYEGVLENDGLAPLDQPAWRWSYGHRPAGLARAVTWFTTIGGPVITPILAVATLALLAWRWRSLTPVVLGALAGLGSLAITLAGKAAAVRPRPAVAHAVPPVEHSFSFPSGHATNATVLAGVIAYLLLTRSKRRSTRLIVVLLTVAYVLGMGLSRVYLGHHWLTDVTAGWLLGLAWLAAIIVGHRLQLTHHRYQLELRGGGAPGRGRPAAPSSADDREDEPPAPGS